MRTDMKIEMICSVCGNPLTGDLQGSKFAASSAMELRAVFKIDPCRGCVSKAERPLRLIKEALAEIGRYSIYTEQFIRPTNAAYHKKNKKGDK